MGIRRWRKGAVLHGQVCGDLTDAFVALHIYLLYNVTFIFLPVAMPSFVLQSPRPVDGACRGDAIIHDMVGIYMNNSLVRSCCTWYAVIC